MKEIAFIGYKVPNIGNINFYFTFNVLFDLHTILYERENIISCMLKDFVVYYPYRYMNNCFNEETAIVGIENFNKVSNKTIVIISNEEINLFLSKSRLLNSNMYDIIDKDMFVSIVNDYLDKKFVELQNEFNENKGNRRIYILPSKKVLVQKDVNHHYYIGTANCFKELIGLLYRYCSTGQKGYLYHMTETEFNCAIVHTVKLIGEPI